MKSIDFIKKEMELLFENIDNYTSYEYLIKSNELKKEYEKVISKKKLNKFIISSVFIGFIGVIYYKFK